MAKQYLPNREIELTKETDAFGYIPKGEAIVSFFDSNVEELNDINMFALYGKWGSGKSTLMKYIAKQLETKKIYKSVFFPAWEFEKDDNLPLSLLHFIVDSTGVTKEEIIQTVLKDAFDVFKSLGKSISFDLGGIKIDGGKMITAGEEYDKQREEKLNSTYNKTKEFKTEFKKAEAAIIKKTKTKKLIVFIDDLDRCEPENVLNLLSAIKLFFTLGENIIFFFGCDKEAISQAVQHRYDKVITADEYLEKVFDITFNMPQSFSLYTLLFHYFPHGSITENNLQSQYCKILANFFQSINFTNPRHLKKILNKYQIVRNFSQTKNLAGYFKYMIPNIILYEGDGDLMETIFTLFFIILHEFYPETFNELEDIDKKISSYTHAVRSGNINKDFQFSQNSNAIKNIDSGIFIHGDDLDFTLKKLAESSNPNRTNPGKALNSPALTYAFNTTLSYFTPIRTDYLEIHCGGTIFIKQFYKSNNSDGEKICLRFCNYLIKRNEWVLQMHSEYKFINFFEMCKVLL